jgi:hypothetical protein
MLGIVWLFSIHIDWKRLIRIERYFNLLGIETPSIHMDRDRTEHGLMWHRFGVRPQDRRPLKQGP